MNLLSEKRDLYVCTVHHLLSGMSMGDWVPESHDPMRSYKDFRSGNGESGKTLERSNETHQRVEGAHGRLWWPKRGAMLLETYHQWGWHQGAGLSTEYACSVEQAQTAGTLHVSGAVDTTYVVGTVVNLVHCWLMTAVFECKQLLVLISDDV